MQRKNQNVGWTRRDFMIASGTAALGAALPLGCGGESQPAATAGSGDPAAKGTPWAGTTNVLDLLESVHLSDVDHHGEFIDFGTAARFKYTLGGWMSGWNHDTSMNGVSFTWASKSPSRLYFSLPEAMDLDFVFRVKKGGTDSFSVYLNDKPLSRVSIKGDGFDTYKVSAAADQSKAGENYFKLIYTTSQDTVAGKPASFAVDYIRIIPKSTAQPKTFDPPYVAGLVQRYKTGDKELRSLMLSSPTKVAYYAEIPAAASLCLSASPVLGAKGKVDPVELAVTVTPADTNAPAQLLKKNFSKDGWEDVMVDLKQVAGKLVKIEIAASGTVGARLALGAPALRVKPPKMESGGKQAKNVVVLLVDTLRADKLSSYGNKRVKTSKMAAFVEDATLFENCQANSNWTKPSCASLLTGLHPDTHKARGHSSRLAKSVKMASEIFRAAGFATGAFIANGYLAAEFGFKRGWNKYVNYIRETKNSDAENVFNDSLAFIKEQGDKPFFTYIQTIDPHVPYDPPEEDLKIYDARSYEGPVQPRSTGNLLEEYKRKRVTLNTRDKRRLEALYDGEITYHDRQFGKFVDELKKAGVLDNTVFLICSDHGEEFFEHESVGHGHTLHQELLHVPLVVRAPGVFPAGKRSNAVAALSDILPTALEATGQKIPKGIEGNSLVSVAQGKVNDPVDASFSSFYSEADERNLQWCVRKGDWKLRMKGPVNTYVYNLADDPGEKTDVDERYPVALRAMRIALGQFIGAPQKTEWMSGKIAADVVGKPNASEDKNENIPEDLKAQLRQLGYMQ